MAFPTFVGAGTPQEATTAAITVPPHASHASGDYELLIIETQDQAVTLATANGFTAHPGSPVSAPSGTATLATRLTVFERIWNGSAGSPVTDATSRNHSWGVMLSFRKSSGTWSSLADARSATVNIGYATNSETTDDTTGSFPDLSSAENQDYLLVGVTAHAKPDIAGGTAEMSAITNGNLSSITERFDDACASGNGGWLGAFTGQNAGGGVPGATTYTKATASFKAHMVIALRDAPPSVDNRAEISWAEFEVPDVSNRAEISWAEFEVPSPNNRAEVSWAELEVPTPNNRAEVSWAELEVPDPVVNNRAEVSWAEFEVPDFVAPDNRAEVSWAELEVPTPNNRAEVSWAELEVPTPDNRAEISWAEFEVPSPNNRAEVSWAEFEVPDVSAAPAAGPGRLIYTSRQGRT